MKMIAKATGDGIAYISKTPYEWEGKNYEPDIQNGDTVKILNEGAIEPGQFGDQHYFKIETRNGEKKAPFNQTSINVLVAEFGEESEGWVGKEVKVITDKATINGKKVLKAFFITGEWYLDEWGEIVKDENGAPEIIDEGITSHEGQM